MTQNEQILEYLKSGRKLTVLDAIRFFGCVHLPRRIMDIEEMGHLIERNTITVIKSNGKKAYVTEYSYSQQNWGQMKLFTDEFRSTEKIQKTI